MIHDSCFEKRLDHKKQGLIQIQTFRVRHTMTLANGPSSGKSATMPIKSEEYHWNIFFFPF
jgi:hypothetical protein